MKVKKEKWADTYYFGHKYEISNNGVVRNKITKQIYKIHLNRNGYKTIGLNWKGKTVSISIHRLEYLSFHPDTPLSQDVHHIDHNILNNKLSNLAAIDKRAHTSMHAKLRYYAGTLNLIQPPPKGITNSLCKGFVVAICPNSNVIKHIMAGNYEMKKSGFDHRGISKVINGLRKRYRGFYFKRIPHTLTPKIGQVFTV